ncbi:hypothetical protein [Hydrogenophaga sp.]|nr:hypothetical protein [Hydrogenophaga sp.]
MVDSFLSVGLATLLKAWRLAWEGFWAAFMAFCLHEFDGIIQII